MTRTLLCAGLVFNQGNCSDAYSWERAAGLPSVIGKADGTMQVCTCMVLLMWSGAGYGREYDSGLLFRRPEVTTGGQPIHSSEVRAEKLKKQGNRLIP